MSIENIENKKVIEIENKIDRLSTKLGATFKEDERYEVPPGGRMTKRHVHYWLNCAKLIAAYCELGHCHEFNYALTHRSEDAIKALKAYYVVTQFIPEYHRLYYTLHDAHYEKSSTTNAEFYRIPKTSSDCFYLSLLYRGFLVNAPYDLKQSDDHMRLAAEAGYPPAQHAYARLFEDTDLKYALVWFQKAAEGGSTEALLTLSKIYLHGVEPKKSAKDTVSQPPNVRIERNIELSFHCCQRAAMLGHVPAQYRLGTMYMNSIGVQKNEDNQNKGRFWCLIAALQGFAPAQYALAMICHKDSTWNSEVMSWLRESEEEGYDSSEDEEYDASEKQTC